MSESAGDKRVFPPPDTPVECFCLHCNRVYMSNLMLAIDIDGETHFCCPAEGCTAMGWEFDVFPVNDDDCVSGQWHELDDDDLELDDDDTDATPDTDDPLSVSENHFSFEHDEEADVTASDSFEPPREWTPESDQEDADDDEEADIGGEHFTQEDYDRLKQSGEIDRRIAEIRERWLNSAKDREGTGKTLPWGDDKEFSDDDIPF